MSYVAKEKEYDSAGPVPAAKIHKIRITLTSSNVRNLEKCAYLPPSFLNCGVLTGLCSQQRLDQQGQGQATPRQGPSPSPDQGFEDHDP